MIQVNTTHIPEDGPLILTGTEPALTLGLEENQSIPLKAGDIQYNLSALMAGQDLLVTGSACFELETECSRCLAPVRTVIRAEKLCFMYEKSEDRIVDVTNDVREELLLAIPVRILCTEDCKGLCPQCGANLNTEKCSCEDQEEIPPPPEESPWSALDQLNVKKKK